MKKIFNLLTTREWAITIWGLLLLLFLSFTKETRKSLVNILKIVFGKKLVLLWIIILLYTAIVTYLLSKIPLWNWTYLKDVLIWLFTCGFSLCANSALQESDETYIKKTLMDNLKIIIILEFYFSTFTFSLWIELLILPIITFLSMLDIYTDKKEEYRQIHKMFSIILSIMGFVILYKTILISVEQYEYLNIIDTISSFLIPIIYLIIFIPLEYFFELYSKYELLFLRLKIIVDNKFKFRWEIFEVCIFSVRKVLLLQKTIFSKVYINMSEEDFKNLLLSFKYKFKKRRKNNMKKIGIYIFSIVGITVIISLYFIFDSTDLVNTLSLTQTLISYITLIIAFTLYDRYSAGNKLNNKTLDIVTDFVEFLSKNTFLLESYKYQNGKNQKNGFSIINFKSDLNLNADKKEKLLVNAKSFIKFYASLVKYINSPWMPDEIKLASTFLEPGDFNNLEHFDELKENILLLQVCGSEFNNEDLMTLNNVNNYQELENSIIKLIETINKWINNQASNINFHI